MISFSCANSLIDCYSLNVSWLRIVRSTCVTPLSITRFSKNNTTTGSQMNFSSWQLCMDTSLIRVTSPTLPFATGSDATSNPTFSLPRSEVSSWATLLARLAYWMRTNWKWEEPETWLPLSRNLELMLHFPASLMFASCLRFIHTANLGSTSILIWIITCHLLR